MIRKAIIVVLMLGALGVTAAGVWERKDPGWWMRSWSLRGANERQISVCLKDWRFHSQYSFLSAYTWAEFRGRGGTPLTRRFWMGLNYENRAVREFPNRCRCAHTLSCPLWWLVAVFAVYPVIAFARPALRRNRRRKRGLCVKCGYNLTGLTEPRCPECGEST